MIRRALLVAAVLLAAPPAAAQVPVAPATETTGYALAGEEVLFTRATGRTLEVRTAAGVRARIPAGRDPRGRIAASPTTAALLVVAGGRDEERVQPFAGPPAGPFGAFGPRRRLGDARTGSPTDVEVDGDRIFTTEFSRSAMRVIVREPGRPEGVVGLPPRVISDTAFAGDLVAYTVAAPPASPDDDEPQRVVVRDWRTGTDRWSARVPDRVDALDLHPDGRVAVSQPGGGILEVAAGGTAVRAVSKDGELPAYAGDGIVFVRELRSPDGQQTLVLASPDGTERPIGVPSETIGMPVADRTRVAYRSKECLVVAGVAAPAAPALPRGPCPRSEMLLVDEDQPTVRSDRRLPVVLHCVAAPPPGCRGTVQLRDLDLQHGPATPRRRFLIPAGRDGRVVLRLTKAAWRAARREASGGIGGAGGEVRAVSVDPAGRRSVLSDGYAFNVATASRGRAKR